MPEVEEELAGLAKDPSLEGVPIAVLFNKTDMSYALEEEELHTALNWDGIVERNGPVECFRSSVLQGTGYNEAFLWLSQHL